MVQCWILKPVQITAHFKVFRSLLISRQAFTMCIVNGSIFPDLSQLRKARSLFLVTQSIMWASLWQGNLCQSKKVRQLLPNLSWHDLVKFKALFSSVLTWIRQNNVVFSSSSLQQNYVWCKYPLQTHGWGQELLFILILAATEMPDFMHIWYKWACK